MSTADNLPSLIAGSVGVGVGAVAWTITEYVSHRWMLHGPFGRGRLARVPLGGLHRAHHADPDATVLPARLAGHGAVAGVGLAASSVLGRVLPSGFARAAACAWTLGYATYELSHWAAHHRAPRTEWGTRLRRRHFSHHFGAPKSNLGVTMSWWDELLGTETENRTARVPGRHAPRWLLGDDGSITPEYRSHFELVDG